MDNGIMYRQQGTAPVSRAIKDFTMTNKKTILLVDDNEADNVYHQIILRRSELVGDVMVTESAVSAMHYLQHVTKQWPHLILVDVNMPGMDGFAFVSELQYLNPPAYCKIAMLT